MIPSLNNAEPLFNIVQKNKFRLTNIDNHYHIYIMPHFR
ncbi:hypothetical protein SpAn4DRAFT_0039 [Sporomusa ovata]|uniref:Uncharacterized protein n=1 Tax=Sporomusa ovata TaxID=2378 RepID=A0A0U1L1M2_9FIRM|nr:hypothetical protein SpAn4DRAFT_0039 [Sporomusa ovata]